MKNFVNRIRKMECGGITEIKGSQNCPTIDGLARFAVDQNNKKVLFILSILFLYFFFLFFLGAKFLQPFNTTDLRKISGHTSQDRTPYLKGRHPLTLESINCFLSI